MIKRLIYFIFAGILLLPATSFAYIASPQRGAFELKFGPYKPNVDDEPGLGTPIYKNTFKDDNMFLTTIELDWQFWHPPGVSLGLGGSVGFMQAYAKAKMADTGEESSDYNVLNVIPMSLMLVIRADVLADKLNIPIVPHFKIGLNWYLWWLLGDSEAMNRDKDSGGTIGWQTSVGISLRLDQLDPMSARTFDNEAGINHSYLFVELLWASVDNFGDGNALHLGTDNFFNATILAGLALEF
jgi:hypothetical protein